MITLNHENKRLDAVVLGEFTLADFQEFEAAVLNEMATSGPWDLLFDLREMAGFTLDVAWEEIRFSREHADAFRRIAVLTDSHWVSWSAWLAQLFTDAKIQVYESESEARDWLSDDAQ